MRARVEYFDKELKTKMYLQSLYPICWTEFISAAASYYSAAEARFSLNARYMQLSESLNYDLEKIHSIEIISVDNGSIFNSEKYII